MFRNLICLIFLLLFCGQYEVEGANILFFIGGIASHSHRSSIQPLVDKLAERGHNVHFLTPLKMKKHPKVTDFCPANLLPFHQEFLKSYGVEGLKVRTQHKFRNELLKMGTTLFDLSHLMCDILLSSPDLIPWVDSSKFDLIVIDSAINDCAFGLAHAFKAKTILYGSVASVMMWDVGMFGLPAELSWVPAYDSMFLNQMAFFDRLYNAYLVSYWSWSYESYNLPRIENVIKKNLGHRVNDMPDMKKLIQSTSLMLINNHYSDQYARPYPPFVIPVGGMHVENSNGTLPLNMEKFVQGTSGFIYISFGSIVKISTIPEPLLKVFLETLASFPNLRFLFKWEGEVPADAPKNILFHSWFPQNDVLAHPKIRGFVMQGGQVSIQQAIFNGVPLIMFPINGDQDFSAKRMREVGNGVELELAGLTTIEFRDAINKILDDSKYITAAKKLAKASRDRPMSPVETAIWWIEYVLRTDDTDLLKPLSMQQPLWIYWSLDIWGFIFCTILSILIVLVMIVKRIVNYFNSTRASSLNNVQKNKIKKTS